MKDLITTIAAITILMVFIMQFSSNLNIMNRVVAADHLTKNYYYSLLNNDSLDEEKRKSFSNKLAKVLGCDQSEITVEEEANYIRVTAPIENVVACAEFLGISDEENTALYMLTEGDV